NVAGRTLGDLQPPADFGVGHPVVPLGERFQYRQRTLDRSRRTVIHFSPPDKTYRTYEAYKAYKPHKSYKSYKSQKSYHLKASVQYCERKFAARRICVRYAERRD